VPTESMPLKKEVPTLLRAWKVPPLDEDEEDESSDFFGPKRSVSVGGLHVRVLVLLETVETAYLVLFGHPEQTVCLLARRVHSQAEDSAQIQEPLSSS
jgi:hypothetical protein